jgi:hypothetical protein
MRHINKYQRINQKVKKKLIVLEESKLNAIYALQALMRDYSYKTHVSR